MLVAATALLMSVETGKILYSQNPTDVRVRLGSVFKPLVDLPEKAQFYCPGKLYVDGHNYTCTHPRIAAPMDARMALAYSCNNFFYHFGGLRALGETISMSPMELLQAYRKLALKHDATMNAGLRDCVRYGTGQLANITGYEVAGKTGTPHGFAWFAGWAPVDKPEVVFVVLAQQGSGGMTAAPIARDMLLKHLGRENEFTIRTRDGIQTMPLEDYVAGVMAGEAANLRSPEALKAIAVAARTYAVRFRGRHREEGFDFCSTTHCQNFRTAGASTAVDATAGEMLWVKGELAETYYSQDCGGLRDKYCPRETWVSRISPEEIASALREARLKAPQHMKIEVTRRTVDGRVDRLQLGDGIEISAEPFRLALGRTLGWARLKSDVYSVDGFTFTGRGTGHGMGLCQRGAEKMPGSYKEILKAFYPGTALGLTAQGIDWQRLSGERVELWATTDRRDLMATAEGLVREVETSTGLRMKVTPRVLMYPTVAIFRNATGQPGWVAGSTRGRVIRLQPAGGNGGTLRHEMYHVLIESNARVSLPMWFREGLAKALAGEGGPVAGMIARYGKAAVVGWIATGVPGEVKTAVR